MTIVSEQRDTCVLTSDVLVSMHIAGSFGPMLLNSYSRHHETCKCLRTRGKSPEEVLTRISHSPSATTVDSGLSASLRDDFAPHHSVNYAFVAKSPCASHPSLSRMSRNEGL